MPRPPRPPLRRRVRVRPRRRATHRRGVRRRRPRAATLGRASGALRQFRQASIVAVAVTAFILLLLGPLDAESAPDLAADLHPIAQVTDASGPDAEPASNEAKEVADVARAAGEEARTTVSRVWTGFVRHLPRIAVALSFLVVAWLIVRLIRPLVRRTLRSWNRANAFVAVIGISVWLLAVGLATTVIAGDLRGMVGSIGLVGLALSWALQNPIESLTGWLLNSFREYYRVGDRIEVGEVFGDVYRIDVLTTTVWEIGSPFRPGFVHAEQPTGRLITFPNNELLTGSVINFTRDFPYLWDELTFQVANESDLRYAAALLKDKARSLLGDMMAAPAREYERVLRSQRLDVRVSEEPEVFVSLEESFTALSIRYLVNARERRKWKSELILALSEELARPEHQAKIISALPRQQLQLLGADGRPKPPPTA